MWLFGPRVSQNICFIQTFVYNGRLFNRTTNGVWYSQSSEPGDISTNWTAAADKYWLSGFYCNGGESSPDDCQHDNLGRIHKRCRQGDELGIWCRPPSTAETTTPTTPSTSTAGQTTTPTAATTTTGTTPTEGDVRLVGGFNSTYGIVEIYHDSEWGTVCDNYMTATTAKTLCGFLGLPQNYGRWWSKQAR